MAAARSNRTKMMKKLSASVSELLSPLRKSTTNLASEPESPVLHAALMGNLQMLRMLLQSGFYSPDVQDSKGMTALHYSSENPNPDVVSFLLKEGGNPNILNSDGNSSLHIACRHGLLDTVNLLLYYQTDVTVKNTDGKTPFDLACEYGRIKIVEQLLNCDGSREIFFPISIPNSATRKKTDDMRSKLVLETSGFHLAAKNGHLELLALLFDHGWDANHCTNAGTALHEAVGHCQLEAVRLLLFMGANAAIPNCFGETALGVLRRHSKRNQPAAKEIRTLIKESGNSLYAQAVCDYYAETSGHISFSTGDTVWVLNNSESDRWKGVSFGPKFHSRSGYFPPSAVNLIDKQTSMHRTISQRQAKKVGVPIVPDAGGVGGFSNSEAHGQEQRKTTSQSSTQHNNNNNNNNNHCATVNGANTSANYSRISTSSYGSMETVIQVPSPTEQPCQPSPSSIPTGHTNGMNGVPGSSANGISQKHIAQTDPHNSQVMNGRAGTSAMTTFGSPVRCPAKRNGSPDPKNAASSLASPHRHRNSTGSNCSQTSSGFESMKSNSQPQVNATVHQLRGDSPPSRNSVHSSGSSSLGSSLERLDESGYASQVNISEMLLNGVPDVEVLAAWIQDLRYEEYVPLFLNSGYDLPTVARMTPEDLTAIGITKPGHRKRLTTEIHKLNIGDPWPCTEPPGGVKEWLLALSLGEYVETFEKEGCTKLSQVLQLTFEDFEDMGIKRLGHLKKLELAIKKLKDYRSGAASARTSNSVLPGAPCRLLGTQNSISREEEIYAMATSNGITATGIRTTAEVRPYSHLPPNNHVQSPMPGRRPQSPQVMMSTFHAPPGSPRSFSPAHQRHSPAPPVLAESRRPNSGYDTFPRRSAGSMGSTSMSNLPMQNSPMTNGHSGNGHYGSGSILVTEAVVHSQPSEAPDGHHQTIYQNGGHSNISGYLPPTHNLQNGPVPNSSRPMVTVKPRPVAKISAKKSRRPGSEELGTFIEEDIGALKEYQQPNENGHQFNQGYGNYVNVQVGTFSQDPQTVISEEMEAAYAGYGYTNSGDYYVSGTTTHERRNYADGSRQFYDTATNIESEAVGSGTPVPSRIHLNLAFSSTRTSTSPNHVSHPVGAPKKTPPPPPPKRQPCSPAPVRRLPTTYGTEVPMQNGFFSDNFPNGQVTSNGFSNGPRLLPPSAALLNDSMDSMTGMSPAPSIDFLPPPSITCEASIKNLRSIISDAPGPSTVNGGAFPSGSISDRSDSASCSSTETLPFANENVGTIRSKHSNQQQNGCSPSTARRTSVKEIFITPSNNQSCEEGKHTHCSRSKSSEPESKSDTGRKKNESGDVLNDIGSMLQNLTDELDALLLDPNNPEHQLILKRRNQSGAIVTTDNVAKMSNSAKD